MKVLQVTRQFHPAVGGIEAVVWHLSEGLRCSGHEVHVLTLNRLFDRARDRLPAEEEVRGVLIRRISYWGSRRYAIAPGVLRGIREYDLVHLHSGDFFLDYLAWTKPIHRRPIVLSTHGMFFHTEFARTLKQIYFYTMTRMGLRQVSAATCDSHQDLQLLSQIAPAEKLYLIPNGIEYDKLSALDVHNRDPNLIISVGRLAENKRFDRLLEAFVHVVRKRPAARLMLVGPDWGVLSSLEKLRAELDLDQHVEFLGQVSDDELLDLLGRASVWSSSSAYESFGIALLEAMAAGCVPVVESLPAFTQLLEDGVEGYHVDWDRPERAADVILNVLSMSHQDRANLVNRARAKASQYSWNAVVSQFQDVYREVIRSHTTL